MDKVKGAQSAAQNAQGMGGGRVSENETSMGDASVLEDKGRGGRSGAGGGSGQNNTATAFSPSSGFFVSTAVSIVAVLLG